MKELSKYKGFRRMYPRLRLSWSLYLLYTRKDWVGIWDYLSGAQRQSTFAQNRGTQTHEWIAQNGYKSVTNISNKIELVEAEPFYQEQKIIKQYDGYEIVAIPDLYNKHAVYDWKTGKMNGYEQQLQLYMWLIGEECLDGFLVETEPIYKDDKIVNVVAKKVFQYKRSAHSDLWEDKFLTMAQDIHNNIKQFDRYLS